MISLYVNYLILYHAIFDEMSINDVGGKVTCNYFCLVEGSKESVNKKNEQTTIT